MKTLTAITGTPSTDTWGLQPQQVTILNVVNPQYPRTVILSTQGVRVARLGVAVGFPIADLIAAAVVLEPTLSWPPLIVAQPVNDLVNDGGLASYFIGVNTELIVTYQWQFSSDGGSTWFNASGGVYSGDTTNALTVNPSLMLNGYLFRCIATNASGVTTSNSASLVVDPDIVTDPASLSVVAPAVAAFTVVASGLTALSYQWQLSTDMGVTWGDLSVTAIYPSVTGSTLNITDSTGLNNNSYRCTVTDTAGMVHSHAALLTVS